MLWRWLFDTPWWMIAVLMGIGAVVFVAGNRRQDKHMMYGGGVFLLLGIALGVLSWLIDTDLEKAEKRIRGIASAVDQRDWNKLSGLLDPNTSFAWYRNRDEIVAGGRETAERIGVKNVRLINVDAEQAGTLITVSVDAISEQDLYPGTTPTSWRFTFENLGSGWTLTRIEPLPNLIVTPEMIQRQLAPRR